MFYVQPTPLGPLGGILGQIKSELGVFWPKIPLNLTSEGLKYPQEVQVPHETCSTICRTPVQAILDQKNLTGLAGGVKEGQNMAQNGPRFNIFKGPKNP